MESSFADEQVLQRLQGSLSAVSSHASPASRGNQVHTCSDSGRYLPRIVCWKLLSSRPSVLTHPFTDAPHPHTSLRLQMSLLIQLMKTITAGNCFPVVILQRGERSLLLLLLLLLQIRGSSRPHSQWDHVQQ